MKERKARPGSGLSTGKLPTSRRRTVKATETLSSRSSASGSPAGGRKAARGKALPEAEHGPIPGLVDAEELATDRQFATNLARGLEVLRAFMPSDPMLGNKEICDRTRLPKATVSRLTYTLNLLGYLTRVDKYQKYRLGPGVLSLGYPLLASLQVRQIARPYMEKIARDTGCSVNLGMRDHEVRMTQGFRQRQNGCAACVGAFEPGSPFGRRSTSEDAREFLEQFRPLLHIRLAST